MAFDGFVNYAISCELSKELIGGKINKVHQPTKNEVILNIYSHAKKYNLLICIHSAACRLHLTHETKPNPSTPSSFCMLLRKHLIGAKLRKIYTNGLDRLTTIELETYNEMNDLVTKKLVIELMGKHSNAILLNENDIIIDSMRHISSDSSYRIIMPAAPYVHPVSTKKDFLTTTVEEFTQLAQNNISLQSMLSSQFLGFSKSHIKYILNKLNIDEFSNNAENLMTIYQYLVSLVYHISLLKIDCIPFSVQGRNDYVLICSENTSNLKINYFIDSVYTQIEEKENFESYRNNILKIILNLLKKYTKRLSNLDLKLEECKNMDTYKLYGELITGNLYQINNNVNVGSITVPNYYNENKNIEIRLDERFSPSINAKNFFKKYHKLKNTFKIATIQKEETKKKLNYIESIIYSLETSHSLEELDEIFTEIKENILKEPIKVRKKKEKTSEPIQLTIDNHLVYIGRNNKQNDYLTFKIAEKNDLWFHAKDIQGSHVILKNSHSLTDDLISKCASLAAFYSKARESTKVEVQYTEVKNIKKPKNSKPGFVVFNQYKSIFVEPKTFE